MPHDTPTSPDKDRRFGLAGYRFTLPTTEEMLSLRSTRPAWADEDEYLRKLVEVCFLTQVAMFLPDGPLWGEVLRAGRNVDWPAARIRRLVDDWSARDILDGPRTVDGVKVLRAGPNFPMELSVQATTIAAAVKNIRGRVIPLD